MNSFSESVPRTTTLKKISKSASDLSNYVSSKVDKKAKSILDLVAPKLGYAIEAAAQRKAALRKSQQIDAYLKEESKKIDPKYNHQLLLLGPADSGKSTVLKQLQLVYSNGIPQEERIEYRKIIQEQVFNNMKLICKDLKNSDDRPSENPQLHVIKFDLGKCHGFTHVWQSIGKSRL